MPVQYNDEQREIIEHVEGPILAASVAGAGKTAALVGRVVRLLEKGIDPKRILAGTFSRRAAREMQERLDAQLGPRSGARIGTFHSVALEILRHEIPDFDSWEINDGRYHLIVKQVTGWGEMEWKEADPTVIERFISLCQCDLASPDSPEAAALAEKIWKARRKPDAIPAKLLEAYARAEIAREEKHILTFDAMMMGAVKRLQQDPAMLARWRARADFVMADEGQDNNAAQHELARLLAFEHENYMLVGDPAQNIYSWRGARPERLVQFLKEWPRGKVVYMNRNYRCGSAIITLANRSLVAMPETTRLPMLMKAERKVGGVVTARRYVDYDEEAAALATRIKVETTGTAARSLRSYAVLYRTAAQSRALEEAFLAERVPYHLHSGVNFYERAEVSDLLAYLRIATGRGSAEAAARCLNRPFRYIGKATLQKVEAEAQKPHADRSWPAVVRRTAALPGLQSRQVESLLTWALLIEECAKRIAFTTAAPDKAAGKPVALLELILTKTKYTEWLQKEEGEETTENSKVSNVRELVRVAAKFASVEEFLAFVDETIQKAKDAARSGEQVDSVTFVTLHSSKGLEWPVVFLIGLNERVLPHARAEDPDEERRLFYVGITRARDELHLSCVREAVVSGRVVPLEPSSFLDEIEVEPEDFVPGAPAVPLSVAAGEAEVLAIEAANAEGSA